MKKHMLLTSTALLAAQSPMFAPADMRGSTLERKDDSGNAPASIDNLKTQVKEFMTGWEEFKSANDQRLKEIEKKGGADPLLTDKLGKIEGTLTKFEDMNQRLTLAEKSAEAVAEFDKKFELIQAMLERTNPGARDTSEEKHVKHEAWARNVVKAHYTGIGSLTDAEHKTLNDVMDEYKSLNLGTSTEGGYLAPVELVREIIRSVTEMSPVRSLARVRNTSFRSVELPKRTGQFAARWVSEQGAKTETDGLTYGVEEITTHEMYALIDITNQMLEDGMFDMVSEINMEASEQFALAEGAAFVNGNGIGKPQGYMANPDVAEVISGSAAGIQDAAGQADGLINLKYSLKTDYARNAVWLMNRTTMGSVRKLKSGDGQYIWTPGIADGRPNTIDGDPYVEMSDMANPGAGTFPIAYGDFRRGYTWVDRITMEFLRDPFTQATGGKVRFIMRKRVAGKVTLAEAIKKLKCAAA